MRVLVASLRAPQLAIRPGAVVLDHGSVLRLIYHHRARGWN